MNDHAAGGREVYALCALAALLAVSPGGRGSAAESPSPLAPGLLGPSPAEERAGAERYATPDGGVRFLLQRSGPVVLVRFEGRREVLALTPTPGPRGDEFLKTDTGRVVLRMTALGGVTFFAEGDTRGAPAAALGGTAPLARPPAPADGLAAELAAIARRTTETVGRNVVFEAPPAEGPASGVVLDAARRAGEGLSRARHVQVRRVVIVYGPRPKAQLEAGALRVVVAPPLGYAGRPSSDAIRAAVAVGPER